MMRCNELSRRGHMCLICCQWREEQETREQISFVHNKGSVLQFFDSDNGPCNHFTPPAPDMAF
jgi:hypothetical protein